MATKTVPNTFGLLSERKGMNHYKVKLYSHDRRTTYTKKYRASDIDHLRKNLVAYAGSTGGYTMEVSAIHNNGTEFLGTLEIQYLRKKVVYWQVAGMNTWHKVSQSTGKITGEA